MASQIQDPCDLDDLNREKNTEKLMKKFKVVSYMEGTKLAFLIICDYMMTMNSSNALCFKWPDRELTKKELEELYRNDEVNTEDWLQHRIIEVHHARRKLKRAQRDRQKLEDRSKTKKGIDDVTFTTTDDDENNSKNRRSRKRLGDFIYDESRKKSYREECVHPSSKIHQNRNMMLIPANTGSPNLSFNTSQPLLETPRGRSYNETQSTPNVSSTLPPKQYRIRSIRQLTKTVDDFEAADPYGEGPLTASEFRTCMRGLVYCLKQMESRTSSFTDCSNSGNGKYEESLEDMEPPALVKSWPLTSLTSFVNQEEELKDKEIRKSVVAYLSSKIFSPYYDKKFGEMTTRLLSAIFAASLQSIFVFSLKTRYKHKMVKFETTQTSQLIKEVVLHAHNRENQETLVDPDDVQRKMKFWWDRKTDNIKKWYSSKYKVTGDALKSRVSNYIEEQHEKLADEIGENWATYFD